jgi:Ca2+:H+ antiporter
MQKLNLIGYVAIPIAFLMHFWIGKGKSWEPYVTFLLASLGVIPLAHLMGQATEHLAERTGPTWGGLLNATFGNAAELIIAVIGLYKGLTEIVKASLTGSILGNLLLVGGAAMVVGGAKREKQLFNAHAAEANSGLLAIAVAGMLFPAIFHFTAVGMHDVKIFEHEYGVSIATSIILLIIYALGLLFTLKTHAHIFSPPPHAIEHAAHGMGPKWSVKKSVIMLLVASAAIGIVAELLVGTAETVAKELGWSHVFTGVIILAIIGNAAEHSTAILMAHRDDMDTAMTITHQSSLQIALFATPFVVLLSAVMVKMDIGEAKFMDLIFTPMEVVSVVLTVGIVVVLGINGTTNWFEGALLLGLYAILAIAFFYIPAEANEAVQSGAAATMPSK